MNGKMEKEEQTRNKILNKIQFYPKIYKAFYNWLDLREKSLLTINNYINHVHEFMMFCFSSPVNEDFYKHITEENIEDYMASLRKNNGDDIRAAKWSSLNTFFRFLILKKYIVRNPMDYTERPKIKTVHEVVYLTPKEIDSILYRIKKESSIRNKNRDLCIVSLGISTGLRVSAITNINVEDINFQTNSIKVIEKGRKTRVIKFGNNFKNILQSWLVDRNYYFTKETNGPLFMSKMKNRISVDSVEEMISKYTDHLNKKITPHKLRSTAAMNLHGAGVDILTIASVLGHEQITTTQRYTKAYDQDKQKATNILDNLI